MKPIIVLVLAGMITACGGGDVTEEEQSVVTTKPIDPYCSPHSGPGSGACAVSIEVPIKGESDVSG